MAKRQETQRADARNWSRRRFLTTTAAGSGSLVIALHLPGCGRPEEAAEAARGAALPPAATMTANAWLTIEPDGAIKVLCDRSEMGQGVYTALPTLIAEELGVPVEAIEVGFAPPGEAYVNALLGGQVTGGSTSVRDAWDKLRLAGAEARERLIAAAAAHWGVAAGECRVADAAVLHGERRLTYGELAGAAAQVPKPEGIELKKPAEFTQIGKPRTPLDAPSKVDGSCEYGIDVRRPGMLYAALAQPPALKGSVSSFNAEAATGMAGVRQVVETSAGVAVLADSWWEAKQARDALEIEWDAGPNAELDNAAIFAGLEAAASGPGQEVRKDGDVEAALANAARRLDAVYELPILAHATLEPQNCTVEFRDGECHVYVPTQVQQAAHAAAAGAAGLPPEKVHIHTTFLGGGFGRRLEVDFVPAAVEAAKAAGKPVKLLWTREDDTTHDIYRPPARDPISAGLDAEGKLIAFKLNLVAPSITARWAPSVTEVMVDPFAIEAAHNYPYDVPNVYVDFIRHEIGIDVGYMRSVSHATNCFVVESFMDEIAHAVGQDPFEHRRALLHHQPRWKNVLELAAAKAGWGQAPAGHFQGIAVMEGYGTYMSQVAEISVDGDELRIHRIVCAVDCGQMINPSVVEAQAFGGIVFGLTSALFGEINIEGGRVKERNFNTYPLLRINQVPPIDVHLVENTEAPGGMGEPSTAVIAPALANAIFAATGKRLRSLPISKHGFVLSSA